MIDSEPFEVSEARIKYGDSSWEGFKKMSLFNRLVNEGGAYPVDAQLMKESRLGALVKPRTFREQMQDQIAYHKSKVADLEGVLESMTPEVEKFVEALQKLS